MEPKFIDGSVLDRWMRREFKKGLIPYALITGVAFFYLQIGFILAVVWIAIRTELMISALRYSDTVNSRRLEGLEEKAGMEVDYELIHSRPA